MLAQFRKKIWLGLVLLLVPMATSAASSTLYRGHDAWNAAEMFDWQKSHIVYGELGGQGDVRFISFRLTQSEAIHVKLGIIEDADPDFMPRVVIYRPDPSPAGPVLPFEQPPKTTALVFGIDSAKVVKDSTAKISYQQIFETNTQIDLPGTVYIAVYNVGETRGRFRLEFSDGQTIKTGLVNLPATWWQAHRWSGLRPGTTILPIGLIIVIGLIWSAVKTRRKVLVPIRARK